MTDKQILKSLLKVLTRSKKPKMFHSASHRINNLKPLFLHTPPINKIKIIGDTDFVKKTEKALNLIRMTDSDVWQTVWENIGIIKSAEKSGMYSFESPPVFKVGRLTAEASLSWYASCICHDAYHSKLYHEYQEKHGKVPDNVWTGRKAENLCIDFQTQFLKKINAPQEEIQHLQNMKNIDYFLDYNDRNW